MISLLYIIPWGALAFFGYFKPSNKWRMIWASIGMIGLTFQVVSFVVIKAIS